MAAGTAAKRRRPMRDEPFFPDSRKLQRGVLSNACDGRSTQGRYVRRLEAELIAHVGGSPTIAETLLIQHVIRLRVRLDAFEEKLDEGTDWSAHAERTYGGVLNAYKNALVALGLKPRKKAGPSLDQLIAEMGGAASP